MSESSSVSSDGVKRQYKCGSCGGLGHNKRACTSRTTVKIVRVPKPAPEPEVDLLSFVPVPAPAPVRADPPRLEIVLPLPPSPPSEKKVVNALDRVFSAPTVGRSPLMGLLRREYFADPKAFTLEQTPHTSLKDGSMHITMKHTHPYTYTHKNGDKEVINSFTLYHIGIQPMINKAGQTVQKYVNLSTVDAERKPILLAIYKP